MNIETIHQVLERHNWRRTAIDLLAALGAITLAMRNEDIQHALRNHNNTPQVAITNTGLSAETIRIIDDQIGTALRNGGQETFVAGTLLFPDGVRLHNPIDIILANGHHVAGGRVAAENGHGIAFVVVNANAPASPFTSGTVNCVFIPDDDELRYGLYFENDYDFRFNKGDPAMPINLATGMPFVDNAGHPIAIGVFTDPQPAP